MPAIGCTEPIAVALAAATAARALGYQAESLDVAVSANLLKNGMGVIVPGCGEMGSTYRRGRWRYRRQKRAWP